MEISRRRALLSGLTIVSSAILPNEASTQALDSLKIRNIEGYIKGLETHKKQVILNMKYILNNVGTDVSADDELLSNLKDSTIGAIFGSAIGAAINGKLIIPGLFTGIASGPHILNSSEQRRFKAFMILLEDIDNEIDKLSVELNVLKKNNR